MKKIASIIFMLAMLVSASTVARAGIMDRLFDFTDAYYAQNGVDVTRMNEDQLTEIRNEKIGFIFQFFNLIPTLTSLENVLLPMQFARHSPKNPNKRARELLELLGLKDRMNHRPSELSGGQQQRVAIARALANHPPLLLADEPTGNLDTESGTLVLETLQQIRQQEGTTVVIVTHDPKLAQRADRVLTLVDGAITASPITASPV